jgi:hypothetical protein
MPLIAIGLVIAAALGGGTALAAQNALPGDALWGFKVHVNENIEGAMSTSDVAKAGWDLSAINTRINEAQTLAAQGTLTADEQADISTNMQAHISDVTNEIAKLESQGDTQDAADVSERLQAQMSNASQTLAQADASANANVQVSLAPILTSVHATLDQASDLSAQTSAQATASSSLSL